MAPCYEISLILRSLEKEALHGLLRKTSALVTGQGGVVRDVHNAGTKVLPYRMKSHMQYAEVGRYAYITADMSPKAIKDLSARLHNDANIIRHNVVKLGDIKPKAQLKTTKPANYEA
eukprot:m.173522 g.173522  ORF g.173522 m.173522 type:complete len:117 (+) comp13705_c0_seq1:137-487(+)